MPTIPISLPDTMIEFVEAQMAAGDYSEASEYFRDLVRAEQKRQAKEQLAEALLSALNAENATGELDPIDPDRSWIEHAAHRRHSQP